MRGRTQASHRRKSRHHRALSPTTRGGTRTGVRGISPPNQHTPTQPSHIGWGLSRELGGHLPERHIPHISRIQEMGRAYDPHFHTAPATGRDRVHTPFDNLGSSTHDSTSKRHSHPPICIPGPHQSLGHATTPNPNRCSHSPPIDKPPRVPMFQYPIPENTLEE